MSKQRLESKLGNLKATSVRNVEDGRIPDVSKSDPTHQKHPTSVLVNDKMSKVAEKYDPLKKLGLRFEL